MKSEYRSPRSYEPAAPWRVSLVSIFGGLIFGMAIGVTPMMIHFQNSADDCVNGILSATRKDCLGPKRMGRTVECNWVEGRCGFNASCESRDVTSCTAMELQGCFWDRTIHGCKNEAGWGSDLVGFFACTVVVGALAGTLIASASKKTQRAEDIILASFTILAGTVLSIVYWECSNFNMLSVQRAVVGIGVGAITVLCPTFVSEGIKNTKDAAKWGSFFQIFITIGILISATMGVLFSENPLVVHYILFLSTLLVLPLIFVAFQWRSGTGMAGTMSPISPVEFTELEEPMVTPNASGRVTIERCIMAGIVISVAQQFTGINAVMFYAPQIMKSAGANPLTGNFHIMLWNCFTSFLAIPLANRISPRDLYIRALAGASVCCLVASFFISVDDPQSVFWKVKQDMTYVGIFGFILFFEIGIGPMFFIIATKMFPLHLRERGCGFVNCAQFIFNAVLNLGFPAMVEVLSGTGSQEVGISRSFFFFGAVGLCCTIALLKLLKTPQPKKFDTV